MIYRLLIFLLLLTACQRKTVPGKGQAIEVDIDTTFSRLMNDEVPGNVLKDVHHLLQLGYEKAEHKYDPLQFRLYYNPELKDSIRIQTLVKDTIYLTIGNGQNKKVALYSYLDLLGYKFYGPEDHWTYIPKLNTRSNLDTTIISYFSLRKLVPSYGASRHGIKAVDTTGSLYNRWMDRLRMANLHGISAGHYGSSFNKKYKNQIITHPEWRGKNNKGEYRDWSSNLKLCYLNPGVIELYKQDALKRLKLLQKKSAPPYYITMDPPDGDGFCQCSTCKSVSDQVYGLANEVAEYLYSIDTKVIITLYGYNEHAGAPSFPLQKNILVGIVPYAFQSVGSPEKMMKQWEETGAHLYLRDYLALPIWRYDSPTYRPNNQFLKKFDHLRAYNYTGYHIETTASFMATGLKFYLLSKASWQRTDESKEYTLFLSHMFPGFEKEVSLIYENLPDLNNRTFSDAMNKIQTLQNKALKVNNPGLTFRLIDLRFYIEYLYLLNQYQSDDSKESVDLLLDKIMSLPGSRLLHPYGLYRILKRKSKVNRPLERTVNHPVDIQPLQNIQFSLRRRVEKEYEALHPDFYLDSVNTFTEIPIRNAHGLLYIGNNHDGKVLFKARLKKMNSSAGGVITFRDLNNQYVTELTLVPDNKLRRFELTLEPDRFYRLYFRTPGSELFFQGPNRPFAFTNPLYTRYTHKQVPYYFNVPNDEHDAIIQIPRKSNEVVLKSGDKVLFSGNQNESYKVDITNQEGKVIEIMMYRHGVRLLNIPQLIALHPKAVIYQNNFEPRNNQFSN